MRKQGAKRKTSPGVQAQLCRHQLSRAIVQHKHLPGIDEAFAFVVVGQGRSAVGLLVNPWNWDQSDALMLADSWVLNRDTWQQEEHPYSGNIHELATKFMGWAVERGITQVAVLVGHPEGAASLFWNGAAMEASFVACLEGFVQRAFKT